MNENEKKHLIFKIGDELFGSPLLSIREVLEYQKPKAMPNMKSSFSGVINVRGAIVGVVDLRLQFGFPAENTTRTAMLLCDTDRGAIAAIVDRAENVVEFNDNDVDRQPAIVPRFKTDYLMGVARRDEKLITLIDLHRSLTEEEFKAA